MRRVLAISLTSLVLAGILLGCNQAVTPPKDADKKIVELDPKIKIVNPGIKDDVKPDDKKNGEKPPIKVDTATDKQEKYEAALTDALLALADRKWADALAAFEAARAIQDTEFIQSEIAKLKGRLEQDGTATATVKNIETVLNEGRAEDAVKLTKEGLKEFGDGDNAPKLIQLGVQAEALLAVQKKEEAEARFARFRAEGDTAVRERNLRAGALAYEQALLTREDPELQKTYDDLREKLDKYDALRKKAAELRKMATELEAALDALKEAAAAWDTPQVRTETDEVQLALAKRRDSVSVADFEVRNDVGVADAGPALADEILPRLRTKYDIIERAQLNKVVAELKLEGGFADDREQQQQVGKLIKSRFIVVGSIRQIGGIMVQARLVDVRTGLVVQTAKLNAPTMLDAINQAPELAKQLLMNDEEKMEYDLNLEARVAKKVEVVAPDAAVPPAPLPPAGDAPAELPKFRFAPAPPPPVEGFDPKKLFEAFAPPPPVEKIVAPPAEAPPPVVHHRLLFATLEMGDDMFRAGRFREANRFFEFALLLAPDNFEVRLRLERVRPLLAPPAPVVIVSEPVIIAKPRLVILPFVNVGHPRMVPPSLSYWTPNHLAPYFASRYEIVDPSEVYWFMGRMGLTMRDVMQDPVARRWLARAVGVRYFLLGSHVETTSFDVNTHLIDAEYGYLMGSGRINVQNRFELNLRLPELASITLMSPAERAAYFAVQQAQEFDRLVLLGRRNLDDRRFAIAVTNFEDALRIRPSVIQVQVYLNIAREQARFQAFEIERQRQFAAQQAALAAQRQRQIDLALAAEAARRQAIADAAARSEAERKTHLAIRVQAQGNLVTQAQVALKTKNFGLSVTIFRGAADFAPPPVVGIPVPPPPVIPYDDFAQARLAAERAAQLREAELIAVREATLKREREAQLAAAQLQLAAERKRAEELLEAQRQAQLERDLKAYNASLAQGQRYLIESKYEPALAAFQGALRVAHNNKQREQVNLFIETVVARQAEALAKSDKEKQEVERKLLVERERRRAAEAQAKANEEKYKLALQLAQKAINEKNYDDAQKRYEEAGQIFKTDAVLTGLRQVESARSALAAQQKAADAEAKKAGRIKQLVADGNAALDAKQYAEAVSAFQQARKLAPDNVDVVAGLTRAEQLRNRLDAEARQQAEAAERTQNFQLLLKNGQANLASKQFEAAVAILGEAVKLNPTDATALAALKQAEQGRDLALVDAKAKAAAKARADLYQKHINDGQLAMSTKRFADAEKAFAEAQKVLPGDKSSLDYMQQAKNALKAADDAVALAAKQRAAEAKKAADLKDALQKGQIALAANDFAKAGQFLNQAKAINPADADVQKALRDLDQAFARQTAEAEAQKKRQVQFQTLLDAGKTALASKNYPDALKSLSSATTLMPQNKEAQDLFRRAQTEARQAEEAAAKAKLQDLITTGLAALKSKNYDAAEKALNSASLVEPNNPVVRQALKDVEAGRKAIADEKQRQVDFQVALSAGQKSLQGKNYPAAITAFQQALKLVPNDPGALALLQQAQQEQAALTKAAENFKAFMDAGEKAMLAKNYPAAVKAFGDASALNPTDALARQRLAQARQALADTDKAAAIQLAYQNAMTSGQASMKAMKYGDAIKSFQDALKAIPSDKTATQQLQLAQQAFNDAQKGAAVQAVYDKAFSNGLASMKAMKYADAINAFQDALKAIPNDKAALQQLQLAQQAFSNAQKGAAAQAVYDKAFSSGLASMKAMKYGDAITSFQEALKAIPNDKAALQQLQLAQQAYNDTQKKAATQAAYDKAMASGQNALKLMKYDIAVGSFQDALKAIPNDKSALQQLQQAQQLWDKAKMPPPDPGKVAFEQAMQRAATAEKDKKYPDAIKAFQDALKVGPKDADAQAGLTRNQIANHVAVGQTYLDQGMFANAQREFESALKLAPKDANIQKLLEKAKKKMK